MSWNPATWPPTDALPGGAVVITTADSIQTAIGTAGNGGTVALRGGTYAQRFYFHGITGCTVRNYPGETAIIDYSADLTVNCAVLWYYQAPNNRVYGLEIIGGYYGVKVDGGEYNEYPGMNNGATIELCKIHDTGKDAIKFTYNADHCTVKDCEIYNTGLSTTESDPNGQGIDAVGADDLLIQGNYVHDCVVGGSGIVVKGGSDNIIIEDNICENTGMFGIAIGAWGTDYNAFDLVNNPYCYETRNAIVRNNTITAPHIIGISVCGALNADIYGNVIDDYSRTIWYVPDGDYLNGRGIRITAFPVYTGIPSWNVPEWVVSSHDIRVAYNELTTGVGPNYYTMYVQTKDGADGLTGTYTSGGNIFNGQQLFVDETGNYDLAGTNLPVQIGRPSADVAAGNWTPSAGADLYAMLDETTPSDTDYVRSGSAPSDDTAKIRLGGMTPPVAGTVTLRVRGKWTEAT